MNVEKLSQIPKEEKKFCHNCGKEKKSIDDNYCHNCGKILETPEIKLCCLKNKPDAEFCGVCGNKIGKVEKLK